MLSSASYLSLRQSASCSTLNSSSDYPAILLLHRVATNCSLKYYLAVFRLLCNPSSPSLPLLIEQYHSNPAIFIPYSLIICHNLYDLRMIDFGDVEGMLGRAARDTVQDVELVQTALQIYFLEIRARLDGHETATQKLDLFLT